jgi:hypothetical protein
VVIISAGINNTNWVAVLKQVLRADASCFTTACELNICQTIRATWDGYLTPPPGNPATGAVARALTADAKAIAAALTKADPSVVIVWTSYYSMADTGNKITRVPRVCDGTVTAAVQNLAQAVQAGLAAGQFVDISGAFTLASRRNLIQALTASSIDEIVAGIYTKAIGYPRPNVAGHAAMGAIVYKKLQTDGVVK